MDVANTKSKKTGLATQSALDIHGLSLGANQVITRKMAPGRYRREFRVYESTSGNINFGSTLTFKPEGLDLIPSRVYFRIKLARLANSGASGTVCYKPAHHLVKRVTIGIGTKTLETLNPEEMNIEHMYFENTNEAEKLLWQYRCGKQSLGNQVVPGFVSSVNNAFAATDTVSSLTDYQYTEDNFEVLTPLKAPLKEDSVAKRNKNFATYTTILELPHMDRLFKLPYSSYEGAVFFRLEWDAKENVVLFNASTGAYPTMTAAASTVTGQSIESVEMVIEGFKITIDEIRRAQESLVKSNISNYYWPVTETFESLATSTTFSQKFSLTERVGFIYFYALDKIYYEKTQSTAGGNSVTPYVPMHFTNSTGGEPTFSFGSYTTDNVWIGKDFPLSELVDVSATIADSGLFPALTNFPADSASYHKGARLTSKWTTPPIYRIDFTNSMINAWEFGEMNGGMQINNGKAQLKITYGGALSRDVIWKFHFFLYKEISYSASGLKVKHGPAAVDPLRIDMQ